MSHFPLYCEACKKQFTGPESMKAHELSVKHIKKVANENESPSFSASPYYCYSCNISCSGMDQFRQHVISPKHTKKLFPNTLTPSTPLSSSATQIPSVESPSHSTNSSVINNALLTGTLKICNDGLYCTVCSIYCTGPECAFSHLTGKKHEKKAMLNQNSSFTVHSDKKLNVSSDNSTDSLGHDSDSGLNCELCNIKFNSYKEMHEHSIKCHLASIASGENSKTTPINSSLCCNWNDIGTLPSVSPYSMDKNNLWELVSERVNIFKSSEEFYF